MGKKQEKMGRGKEGREEEGRGRADPRPGLGKCEGGNPTHALYSVSSLLVKHVYFVYDFNNNNKYPRLNILRITEICRK